MNDALNVMLITEVCDRTRLSKPTIYKLINAGRFPKQIKLSAHRVVWLAKEVDDWLQQKAEARQDSSAGESV